MYDWDKKGQKINIRTVGDYRFDELVDKWEKPRYIVYI